MEIKLITGDLHIDARGVVSFANDFDLKPAVRFYTIRAHEVGKVRGWVGHRKEH